MAQIDKNTVAVKDQLKPNEAVTFERLKGSGKRVMFVGNSITRHGVADEIGWHWDFGMAASSIDKDYVHLLIKHILADDPDAAFCICQVWEWELNYREGEKVLDKYAPARAFEADVIIMRCIENCAVKDFDSEAFCREYKKLIDYLDPTGRAKVILTTSFWNHPEGDRAIKSVAAERGYPAAYLGDLGEDDSMKAIGLFEHDGVANHPGDKGMAAIAERIAALL